MRALVNTPGTVLDLIRECSGLGRPTTTRTGMPLGKMFERGFAIPSTVGHLVSTLRSGIWGRPGREWGTRFAHSIAVGGDFGPFADRLLHVLLTDDGNPNPFCDPADRRCVQVADLYARRLDGAEPSLAQWKACIPPLEAGGSDRWSFAVEAARIAAKPPDAEAVSNLLNCAVLEHPPGLFKKDSRALWRFLGFKCIEVAESCRAPADAQGEPEACVLRQRPDGDYGSRDVVCAGTEAHCLAMLQEHPDEHWCVVEGRDSLVMLGVVNAGPFRNDDVPMPSPFDAGFA